MTSWNSASKKLFTARHQWLTPIILTTQETEIRKISFQNQPRQIVQETLYQKNTSQKRASGVAQGVGPEFKLQHQKKKKKKKEFQKTIYHLGI
jgi:hypothetical protein